MLKTVKKRKAFCSYPPNIILKLSYAIFNIQFINITFSTDSRLFKIKRMKSFSKSIIKILIY